jgi:RNA polymerase sigma factor (sigma-70 family)
VTGALQIQGVTRTASPDRHEREARDIEDQIGASLDAGNLHVAAALAIRGIGRPVLLYLVKLLQDHNAAQEVFSRTCEKLWRGIGGFRRESTMATWFHRIAWNAARDYRMEARHRHERRLDTSEVGQLANEVRVTTLRYLKTEVRDRLAKLKQELDVEDRSLLVLRVERAMSWKDVALVMSKHGRPVDERTLRKRYERLKTRLRKLAQAEGLLEEA